MMERAALALLALLLVPVAAVGAVGDPDLRATAQPTNTSEPGIAALTLEGLSREEFTNGSLDVSAALSVSRHEAALRLEQYAFEVAWNRTDSRAALVDRTLDRIAERTTDLRRVEREAWEAYANGSADTHEFFRRLAETSVAAGRIDALLSRIGALSEGTNLGFQDRVNRLRRRVVGLSGPVRSRLAVAIQRGVTDERVYVAVTRNGISLATISDGRYVRETYRMDRLSDRPSRIERTRAFDLEDILVDAYHIADITESRRTRYRGVFTRHEFEFGYGSITAYLDGGTERVFHDVHVRRLGRQTGGRATVAAANGTRLLVNRSYPGGPLRIAVFDNATGVNVPATVIVDGHRVRTGSDGVVWTLTPPKRVFTVTAIGPGGRVTDIVAPTDPVPLDDG